MASSATPGDRMRQLDESRPDAVQVDSARVVAAGTALWALAALCLLPFYSALGRSGHRIWLWTCLAGVALGVVGLLIIRRHRGLGRTS
jgi:Protein of unknown function (DUF2530)